MSSGKTTLPAITAPNIDCWVLQIVGSHKLLSFRLHSNYAQQSVRILHSSIYEQVLLVIPVVHALQPCSYHKATLQLSTGVKNGKCIFAWSSDQLFTSTRAPATPHERVVLISSVKLKPSKAAHGMPVRAYSASALTRPVRKSVSVLIAAESRLRADIRQNQSKRAPMHSLDASQQHQRTQLAHEVSHTRGSGQRCHCRTRWRAPEPETAQQQAGWLSYGNHLRTPHPLMVSLPLPSGAHAAAMPTISGFSPEEQDRGQPCPGRCTGSRGKGT